MTRRLMEISLALGIWSFYELRVWALLFYGDVASPDTSIFAARATTNEQYVPQWI